jgi:hypothetical protein
MYTDYHTRDWRLGNCIAIAGMSRPVFISMPDPYKRNQGFGDGLPA